MHEEPPGAQLLLDRVIHEHARRPVDAFIVDVCDDADDAPGIGADADEPHHAVGPHQMTIDRILSRKEPLRERGADDDHAFGCRCRSASVKSRPDEERNAESREKAGRHRSELATGIVFSRNAGQALDGELKSAAEIPGIAPGHGAADCDAFDARHRREPSLYFAIELADLGRACGRTRRSGR